MAEDVDDAWAALRECLEARSRELHDELCTYPTPIARCDEQLTRVLEERDAAFRGLRLATELETSRTGISRAQWLRRLRQFAAHLEGDDARVGAAHARLMAALAR
ncbi:MAG TPA: hypothetical protein VLW55_02030 [Burkholderiaceae bacterium]|nr:hypothetical protein [Burkholderiaceae bacterium]